MRNVASWIRECDEAYFQIFFDRRRDLTIFNARRAPVDFSDIDGLLLTGGPDVSAGFLKQKVSDPALIKEPDAVRDAWEFAALRHALDHGKPVLAICKGHQILNVALGGTLHLDIPNHSLPEQKTANIQPMRYAEGARHRYEKVNSSHHQAIDRPGDGLEIEAWCVTDDVIEQVRLRDYPFCLGVQYHPERDVIYAALFDDFFDHVDAMTTK